MLWESVIMPSAHPRRVARESVLEALFANQFSDDKPELVLRRILDSNPDRETNLDFIELLFHSVIKNVKLADKVITSHLQNWEFDRVAQIDRLLLRMGICEIFFLELLFCWYHLILILLSYPLTIIKNLYRLSQVED